MNLEFRKPLSRQKVEISRSYIDEDGNLHLHETSTEKFLKKVSLILSELPPIGIFLVGSLAFLQFYVVIGGLVYHSTHPLTDGDLRMYGSIFIFAGIAIAAILKLAWLFVEEKEQAFLEKQQRYDTSKYEY